MDLAGIEPASEYPSPAVSSITAAAFILPLPSDQRPSYGIGSSLLRLPVRSIPGIVSRDLDAGYRIHGEIRVDERN